MVVVVSGNNNNKIKFKVADCQVQSVMELEVVV